MQAPTDNLYKFMAIAGLICSLFFYFDYNKRYDLLNGAINLQRMENVVISSKIEAYRDKQSRVTQRAKEVREYNPTLEMLEVVRKEFEANQPDLNELSLLQAKSELNIKFIKESKDQLDELFRGYIFLGVASLMLCLFGMSLWYFRTQKYLDLKEKVIAKPETKPRFREALPRRK